MSAAAIFVKTPGRSRLKTRLAATLGQETSEALYLECARAVAAAVARSRLEAVYWATAEPASEVGDSWPGFEAVNQGSGGLGERMHRVMKLLVSRHGSGLLLGADAPQLDPAVLDQASDWLAEDGHRCVIGPATDGGFWTFGANRLPGRSHWTTVTYSQPDTLSSFRQKIGIDAEWLELPALTDLDTHADTGRVITELCGLESRLPEQSRLLYRLEALEPET